MLSVDKAALLVVDVQQRLAPVMDQKERLYANLDRMIRGAQLLDLPVLWTEQVPEKLGPTLPEFSEMLVESSQPIWKSTFSCWGSDAFVAALEATGRRQILLTGIESHVCVYQTGLDLVKQGFEVQVVTDAVASRVESNRQLGLERMVRAGALPTSTEMSLFELLGEAGSDTFRAISKLVK